MANNNLPDNIAFGIICEHQGHYPAEFLHKSATNFFLAFTITNLIFLVLMFSVVIGDSPLRCRNQEIVQPVVIKECKKHKIIVITGNEHSHANFVAVPPSVPIVCGS